jgi:hypothetical protein
VIKIIRGIITNTYAAAGKLLKISLLGRIKERIAIQQYGLQSRPRDLDQCVAIIDSNSVIVIGTDTIKRIPLEKGDVALVSDINNYVKLLGTGGIEVYSNGKVEIKTGTVTIGATVEALVKKTVLSVIETHVHPASNMVSPQLVALSNTHYTTKLEAE